MSFNLDKTDQTVSKFNLSKGDKPPVAEENKKSPRKGVWIIIALLTIGGLAWYLLREKPAADNYATAIVPAGSQSPVVKDSPVAAAATDDAVATVKAVGKPQPGNEGTATVVNSLQNSVPGSFDPGSSSVHPEAAVVNNVVNVLSKNPGKKIVVKGYASSEGDVAVNRQLSGQRAKSFKEYLVSKGIHADRITTEAKGTEDPIATNDTEEGRKKNRRVQVTITD